jgi:hypothetical protein
MAIKQANAVTDTDAVAQAAAVVEPVAKAEVLVEPVAKAEVLVEPVAKAEVLVEPVAESRAVESASVLEDEPEPAAAVVQPAATGIQQAAAPAATQVAVHRGAFLDQIITDLQGEGFEGTELDYSSFLNVTLNKQIETSEGQELPNNGFLVRLASARKKFCFRNNNPVEDDVEVAYSYDLNAPLDPESQVAKSIAKWKEEGLDLAPGKDGIKEYLEVLAQIIDDKVDGDQAGELNGKLITIQIAPTSQGRWAGYLVQLKLAKKGISDVKTLCRRGKKVESGKFPFYPWDFVNKGALED